VKTLKIPVEQESQIAYNIRQTAKLTSLSKNALAAEIKEGRLESFKCGRRRLISHEAIISWITLLSNQK